jgi:hypothetical protein
MEAKKRIKYSKQLETDEIEEIMMEEESDEESEEINDSIDPHENVSSSSSSSEDEDDDNEELEMQFRVRRPGDSANILDFTGPPNGINRTAAPNINATSSTLSIFIFFFQLTYLLIYLWS